MAFFFLLSVLTRLNSAMKNKTERNLSTEVLGLIRILLCWPGWIDAELTGQTEGWGASSPGDAGKFIEGGRGDRKRRGVVSVDGGDQDGGS